MKARFAHTNLVARDWRRLADFYTRVFGCELVPPVRSLRGEWLAAGTGVEGAALEGAHLRLPGPGPGGPTLEIFQYTDAVEAPQPVGNRLGFGHIAFMVDDVVEALGRLLAGGGSAVGRVVSADVPGRGRLTFVYAADPEGNLIELQRWD